ncbi:MAG: SCO6880 family protein, partial [Frankia sp.]
MSAGEGGAAAYRLTDRQGGGVLFGMTAVQVGFVAVGVGALVFLPAVVPPRVGIVAGLGVVAVCAALAFLPVGGRPLHAVLVTVTAFGGRRFAGRQRWMTPLPWSTPVPGRKAARDGGELPPCLTGLDLMMAPRPEWAGGREMLAPVGLVRDRRTGGITVVVPVRGGEFSLLDPADRRVRLGTWAQLLSQFARESSPVVRLGWTLWSAPAPLAEHLGWVQDHQDTEGRGDGAAARAAEAYRRLVDEAAPTVTRHDLHVWLTIDARRLRRRADPVDAALAAARALAQRCH